MITTKKTDFDLNKKILDKAEVIARTVMSQQSFYFSKDCNRNHRQLLETMVGAAIWYLPLNGYAAFVGCWALIGAYLTTGQIIPGVV